MYVAYAWERCLANFWKANFKRLSLPNTMTVRSIVFRYTCWPVYCRGCLQWNVIKQVEVKVVAHRRGFLCLCLPSMTCHHNMNYCADIYREETSLPIMTSSRKLLFNHNVSVLVFVPGTKSSDVFYNRSLDPLDSSNSRIKIKINISRIKWQIRKIEMPQRTQPQLRPITWRGIIV